ncbi:MAG: LysM peptidoglycan-binding domain-containing protein, partial [Clostridia bacterium]|nr:LysM peptidoglycan-binding domain-containing protein [Clostridia bacterium]
MIIHTAADDESILSLSKKYRINPEILAAVAGYEIKDTLTKGEEVLIPIPTRSYTVKDGDTLGAIARRFGTRREALLCANPQLMGDERLYPAQVLALRYENMGLGMAAACGYLSPSCKKEKLISALPYLTYVALCHGSYNGKSVRLHSGIDGVSALVRDSGKIPLLRIFDISEGEFLSDKNAAEALGRELIEICSRHGLSGIIFASYKAARDMGAAYADFIVKTRRAMIGSELILLTECDERAEPSACELSDGAILVLGGEGGFETPLAEKKALEEVAERCESSKIFVDIPAYALYGKEIIPSADAMRLIKKSGSDIQRDTELSLSVGKIKNTPVYFEGAERV